MQYLWWGTSNIQYSKKKYIRYRFVDPKIFRKIRTKKLENGINLIYGFY